MFATQKFKKMELHLKSYKYHKENLRKYFIIDNIGDMIASVNNIYENVIRT